MRDQMRVGAAAVLSVCVSVLVGCGTGGALGTTTTPPPVSTEPNSCSGTLTTSPAQPAPTPNYAGAAFTGKVMTGAQPLIGATVQLYAAGATGNGSTPTALGSALTTDGTGSFTETAGYTCPESNSVLYVTASGGKAGAAGSTNGDIVLASVVGLCNGVSGTPQFTVNELTTVGTAWAMQPFFPASGATGGKIGASATNGGGIALAAGTFANLINPQTGTTPGLNFPATGTAPTGILTQAANLLNACAGSSGATSAGCTQLLSLTGGVNTFDAAVHIAANPANKVAALYTLSAGSTAYAPGLSAAPTDWMLYVKYTGGGMNEPSAVSIDSTGKVWVANYNSVASLFTNTGTPVFAGGITGNGLLNSYGGAVDVNDVMWIANENSHGVNGGLGSVSELTNTGALQASLSNGGLDFPISIAMDTSGTAWVVDYGNSYLTLFSNSGTVKSGTNGYTSSQFDFPVFVATDAKCNGYIANSSSNTVTLVLADGSQFTSYVVGNGPTGIAVDQSGNVWTTNYYGDSIGVIGTSGTVLTGSAGVSGGGIKHPQSVAIDGNGVAWVANYRAYGLSKLTLSSGAVTVNSPSPGLGQDAGLVEAFSAAIDAGGSLWVSSFGKNELMQFVGVAAPVKTPMLGPVRVP